MPPSSSCTAIERGLRRKHDAMDPADLNVYLDRAAAIMSLPIAPEHRSGVLLNLERLAAMARLLEEAPLGREDEPAPVFRP